MEALRATWFFFFGNAVPLSDPEAALLATANMYLKLAPPTTTDALRHALAPLPLAAERLGERLPLFQVTPGWLRSSFTLDFPRTRLFTWRELALPADEDINTLHLNLMTLFNLVVNKPDVFHAHFDATFHGFVAQPIKNWALDPIEVVPGDGIYLKGFRSVHILCSSRLATRAAALAPPAASAYVNIFVIQIERVYLLMPVLFLGLYNEMALVKYCGPWVSIALRPWQWLTGAWSWLSKRHHQL